MRAFQLNPADTVATMLADAPAGDVQIVGTSQIVRAVEAIAMGHKIAIVAMKERDPVIKYGISIGTATQTIEPGQWVHLHNCRSQLDERSNGFDLYTGQSGDILYE